MTTLESFNPATGALVGEVPVTPSDEIPVIVARSRAAQRAWQELGVDRRGDLLCRASEAMVSRAEKLGKLLTEEMGKPLAEAIGEIKSCGEGIAEHMREVTEATAPEVIEDGRTRSTIYHDPYGVCAAITPWNFPFAMPHWMVLPALATGNTVVLKPSEETPLIAQAYVDLLNEVLPPDVLLAVHGADDQGKVLVQSDVDLIAFTGSRETGKHIMAAASTDLKRIILELGGKDPLVVLEDADLATAAKFAANSSFRNAGQVCVSTERIYVPRSVSEKFVDLLVQETAKMKLGSGLEDGTRVGPMINARQRDHVLAQIDEAVSKGAKVVAGGEGHRDNFVVPTVLTDVTHDMSIGRDETFGPVACVTVVDDEDEAVRLANDTPFGLGAVVFGGERAAEAARRLTAGMIGINKSCGGAEGTPWVGARQSGYSFHSSKDGHRNFTQTRVVSMNA